MRENIGLFKAKRLDNGEEVQGYYWTNELGNHFIRVVKDKDGNFINAIDFEIDPETLCEFTGLTDKNGKMIWENDILWADGSYELTVCWDDENAMFYAEYEGTKSGHEDDDNDDYAEACDFINYEVIGNKFDSPELLEKGGA